MRLSETLHYIVVDVESLGLYGLGFAFGAVVMNRKGEVVHEVSMAVNPETLPCASDEDREWVRKNVTFHETHPDLRSMYSDVLKFLRVYLPGGLLFADVPFPVETNFLSAALNSEFPAGVPFHESPYPLLDVASFVACNGNDPTQSVRRQPDEIPAHNALMDARQSARMLRFFIPPVAATP